MSDLIAEARGLAAFRRLAGEPRAGQELRDTGFADEFRRRAADHTHSPFRRWSAMANWGAGAAPGYAPSQPSTLSTCTASGSRSRLSQAG
jgi:hypothetical protein